MNRTTIGVGLKWASGIWTRRGNDLQYLRRLYSRQPASRHRLTRKQLQLQSSRKPLSGALQKIYAVLMNYRECNCDADEDQLEPPDLGGRCLALIFMQALSVQPLTLRQFQQSKIQNLYD